MKVLDLFAGLGGWSKAFKARGHIIHTLDIDKRFHPTYCRDILTVDDVNGYDCILASPPCEAFSVASFWRQNFVKVGNHYEPNNGNARLALRIVEKTFSLIQSSDCKYWFVENPRGLLRKVLNTRPTTTVWYCQYGLDYAKPTDIWTNANMWWKPECVNNSPICHHNKAPRGTKIGGLADKHRSAAERAMVPYQLSEWVCNAIEKGPGIIRRPYPIALSKHLNLSDSIIHP